MSRKPPASPPTHARSARRFAPGGAGQVLTLLAALVTLAAPSTAQPNDDCFTAQPLAVGDSVSANTDGAFPDVDFPIDCVFDNQFLGLWYQVTGDGTTLTASTCSPNTDFNTCIAVFCGGCNDLFCVGFNDDFACDFNAEFSWCTEVGTTYYIMVAGPNLATGTFELRLTSDGVPCDDPPRCEPCLFECPPGSVPEGETPCFDDYKDRTNGGCNADIPAYSNIAINGPIVCGTTGTFIRFDPDQGFLPARDEDWYRFTITQPTRITAHLEARLDAVLALADLTFGCPPGEFLAGARADACRRRGFDAWLYPGTYALVVFPQDFNSPCGEPYALELDGVAFTPPANDFCTAALPVAIGSSTQGSTVGARVDIDVSVCGEVNTAPGVWYRVIGNGQALSASTCAFSDYDSEISIYCGDCSSLVCIASNADDDFCAPASTVSWCSRAGAAYYILVHGFGSEQGAFELSVEAGGAPCAGAVSCSPCLVTPTGAPEGESLCRDNYVDLFNGGCDGSSTRFSAIACGQTMSGTSGTFWRIDNEFGRVRAPDTDWYRFVLDEPSEVTVTFEAEFPIRVGFSDLNNGCAFGVFPYEEAGVCAPASVTALLQPGVYAVVVAPTVFQQVPCGARYNITFDCAPAVFAPNDSCDSAAALSLPAHVTGSTRNATLDIGVDSCFFSGAVSPGVWYSIVGNGNELRASLCTNTDFDARMSILCGPCEAGLCIAFGDDECAGQPEVTWCSEPGRTYHIFIHGADDQGDFTLDVVDTGSPCDFPATCPTDCRADLSGSSDPDDPAYGIPDGVADASDFFYFLDQFAAGNLFAADLTGSSDPSDPTYGAPDGVLDAGDFFYFLDAFFACEG